MCQQVSYVSHMHAFWLPQFHCYIVIAGQDRILWAPIKQLFGILLISPCDMPFAIHFNVRMMWASIFEGLNFMCICSYHLELNYLKLHHRTINSIFNTYHNIRKQWAYSSISRFPCCLGSIYVQSTMDLM